jgi:inorganic triphosphatase YgiF
MEIEAKFTLSDAETIRALQATEQLAGFALSASQVKQVRDIYLDTVERLILAAKYACRQREQDEGILITLKGLRGAKGAVHQREELEVSLPTAEAVQRPAQWPASTVREQVLALIGDQPLRPLFELQQTRIVRQVCERDRSVAEFSLDKVRLAVEGREQVYFELEVELKPQGTEGDLVAIVDYLQDTYRLEPEPRSKFERALSFLEGGF